MKQSKQASVTQPQAQEEAVLGMEKDVVSCKEESNDYAEEKGEASLHHSKSGSGPSQDGGTTYPVNHIDGQAARRMIENIKIAEIRITELKKECCPRCSCKVCKENGYTRKVRTFNMEEVLWSGFVVANPNTSIYKTKKAQLNYRHFAGILIGNDLKKVKYYVDKDLYLPMIKITHIKGSETKESRFLCNWKEIQLLYVQIILAYLSVNCRYWVETKSQECVEGQIYKRYSINGNWEKKTIKIEKGTISEGNQAISVKSPCIWTSFQMIEWEVPHLIVKIWQGFWKAEYGLPINRLPQWLFAFLSLISID